MQFVFLDFVHAYFFPEKAIPKTNNSLLFNFAFKNTKGNMLQCASKCAVLNVTLEHKTSHGVNFSKF